ncbi:hypothetical protein [Streptomyces sp. NBC_00258]|uniref:hypothetical protein n=1 Tax=Streptomyces sp. NBC_00258 TaxID=2903642 RepID=UPI002E2AB431|nr:hypothetical protein [Streptomyces sp. NBC_00258]
MTSSAFPPPISEPDPSTFTCSSSLVGPCSGCQRSTHRYGSGGLPLCHWCITTARENWGTGVRFNNTRTPVN